MLIGSTGFTTFVDPAGDLHKVIQKCRGATILLLDPLSEGASSRARSIQSADITMESFRTQIAKCIEFLKGLKDVQMDIRLKLYRDVPLLKLAILGDYVFLRHYHHGADVQKLPEFVSPPRGIPVVSTTLFINISLTGGMTLPCLNISWRLMNSSTETRRATR